jgi:chromosome condensin MukBEF complex kleisin-like MukF subunit
MQVDHISLVVRLTVPEKVFQGELHTSPSRLGKDLATAIDHYSRENKLGYYPAIEFIRKIKDIDQSLVDEAERIAWIVCKLAREEVQSRLCPVFSSVKFKSVQTEAFAMPAIRPNQASAFDQLVRHCTPDSVKLEIQVSMLRKDDDQRGEAAEAYARKMIFRWLKPVFENIEITASVAESG